MTHCIRPLLIALFLAGSALSAHADQLAWIPRDAAEAAVKQLQPGTLFVDWVSHNDHASNHPTLHRVETVSMAEVHPGYWSVQVTAKPLLASSPHQQGDSWSLYSFYQQPPHADAEPMQLDLAYVYVPSTEIPGTFVNLGKKLRLEADIRHVAIELPAELLKRVAARPTESPQQGMSDMLLGQDPCDAGLGH